MAKGDICQIKNCNKSVPWGKICSAHYARKWRHGNYEYNPNWNNLKKGTALKTALGYLRINVNGKRVLHHRYIMEQYLNRKLKPSEIVHHKNHIRDDNRIENLEIIDTQSNHIIIHHPKKPLIDWSSYKIPHKANKWTSLTKTTCLVRECTLESVYRNLCGKHYQSYRKSEIKKISMPEYTTRL